MKAQLLNEALAVVRANRQAAEALADKNKKLALQDEQFSKLYIKYTDTMLQEAKKAAFKEKFTTKLPELEKQMQNRLNELGIASISPNYSCKKCQDLGLSNGKYCTCLKQEISKILLDKSGFGELNDFANSNFDIFENKAEMKKIYSLMQQWCNKDSQKNLIFLTGATGTGKTHLLSCMANELIRQNKLVMLTTAFNMFQICLKYHTAKEKTDILDDLLSCEVLFIDDLGSEPFLNNISREYLYLIINERRMKGLRTVITSNLEPFDLRERYDERAFSRIMDNNTSIRLKITGLDLRTKK